MNLRRLACFGGLLLLASVGCCHSRHAQCVSSDPCDPCGCSSQSGHLHKGWMGQKTDSWRIRKHGRNYGWNDVGCECGCDACGMGMDGIAFDDGFATGGFGGMVAGGNSSGCACGQHHSEYAPSVPGSVVPSATPAPTPMPQQNNVPPTPPTGDAAPAPAIPENNSTAVPRTLPGQVQHVSVEEFHRLPGVITSGPTTQSSVPSLATSASAAQPPLALPALSNVAAPAPARPASAAQQASWVPSKP